MEIKVKTKFDIGDTAYKYSTVSNSVIELKIKHLRYFVNENGISGIAYTDNRGNTQYECDLFKTIEECEKNYVLTKFSHLFKDTKTLK